MLLQFLKGDNEWWEILLGIFISVLALIVVLPIHEWAHAYTAFKLGDESQKTQGRLSLNPLKHIDPLGAICLVLVGFGWAKPVYVNTSLMNRGGRFASAAVSFAGPASNLVLGLVFCFLFYLLDLIPVSAIKSVWALVALEWLQIFVHFVFILSIRLAVLNLIPVPPFDGYGVISPLLPDGLRGFVGKYQRYITLVFFVLIILGVLTKPISIAADWIITGMENLAKAVLGC